MSINDLKIYTLNTLVMAVSFTNIENTLKILLLCASIVYTVAKTIPYFTKKKKKDE
jgi:hypothetical protein